MTVVIRPINQEEQELRNAHSFQCQYLDAEAFADFEIRVKQYPQFYFVAMVGVDVVGVCYGEPFARKEGALALQGVAVDLNEAKGYARTGIGSRLLRAFEESGKQEGFRWITVGSADDRR